MVFSCIKFILIESSSSSLNYRRKILTLFLFVSNTNCVSFSYVYKAHHDLFSSPVLEIELQASDQLNICATIDLHLYHELFTLPSTMPNFIISLKHNAPKWTQYSGCESTLIAPSYWLRACWLLDTAKSVAGCIHFCECSAWPLVQMGFHWCSQILVECSTS